MVGGGGGEVGTSCGEEICTYFEEESFLKRERKSVLPGGTSSEEGEEICTSRRNLF